ncbi:MAG: hypothetical protein U0746_21605 [Gemmataceae bacterium]
MTKTTKPADCTLTPATEAELLNTEGGLLVGGDGYCGTPYPGWPRPGVFNLGSIVSNPILVGAVKMH